MKTSDQSERAKEQMIMDDIETGTTRTLLVIGRDVCAAARNARAGETTYLTVNGDRVAAITPMPLPGSPDPCHYCNMFVSRDREGQLCAANPAIEDPWHCPASANGAHHTNRKTDHVR